MGYGGALIWTGLARNLKIEHPDKKIILIYHKGWKEIVLNRQSPDHIIYRNNPDITRVIDKLSWKFASQKYDSSDLIIIDMNDTKYHYWEGDNRERIFYKTGKHAIQIACNACNLENPVLRPRIVLTDQEKKNANLVIDENGLKNCQYICVEPQIKGGLNQNKAWFWDRWQELADRLNQWIQANELPWKIVQVGAPGGKILKGVVDITGKTTFREAAGILENSFIFIAYVGGLVHLAAAVEKTCIVMISAWEPEELAAYPGNINLYSQIDCANCGLKVPCPIERECMKRITTDDVFNSFLKYIEKQGIKI